MVWPLKMKRSSASEGFARKDEVVLCMKDKEGLLLEEVHSKYGHEELTGHKEVKKCVAINNMWPCRILRLHFKG